MTFKYKNLNLTCDEPIKDITQEVKDTSFYGNKYLIAMKVTPKAAREIAMLLNQFVVCLYSRGIITFNYVEE